MGIEAFIKYYLLYITTISHQGIIRQHIIYHVLLLIRMTSMLIRIFSEFLAKVLFTAYIWQWKELSLHNNHRSQELWLGIILTGTSG